MRRISVLVFVTSLFVLAMGVSVAMAASVHLKGGPDPNPTFVDEGLSLSTAGTLAGLANETLEVELGT